MKVKLTPMEMDRITQALVRGGVFPTVEEIIQERIDTITSDTLVPLLAQKFRDAGEPRAWTLGLPHHWSDIEPEEAEAGIRAVLAAQRGE